MGDGEPDYYVEQFKLREHIAQMEYNLARFNREIVEYRSRINQAQVNIKATEEAIAKDKKNLASLVKAHGDATGLEE